TGVSQVVAGLDKPHPRVAETVVAGLLRGWPRDKAPKLDAQAEAMLATVFTRLSPAGRANLISLAVRWENDSLRKHAAEIAAAFGETVADSEASDEDRIAAAVQLVDFRKSDADAVRLLADQLGPRTSPQLSQGLLDAIGRSEAKEAGAIVLDKLPMITPAVRSTAIRVLLSRGDWTMALMDAVEQGKLPFSDLALDQRQALAAHPDAKIAAQAKKLLAAGGGLP